MPTAGLVDLEVKSNMAGGWRMSVIGIVMAAMPAVVCWAAGMALQFGGPSVSIGTLVAFVSLQQGLFRPTVSLLSTGVQIQTSLALFQRIFEYLDLPIDITEPERPVHLDQVEKGEIRFEDVEFPLRRQERPDPRRHRHHHPRGRQSRRGRPDRLRQVHAQLLVPRLYDVTGGRVTLDGVDVRDLDFDTLARGIGVVSQETYLFHASSDNLRFARPDATDEELQAAARAAQIHDHIASLPDGYDTVVGERGHRFSGGEKQRLAIARTILRDPPVLILDEATSALDTRTEYAVPRPSTPCRPTDTLTIAHGCPPSVAPTRSSSWTRPCGRTRHARGVVGAGGALCGAGPPGR